MNELIYIVTEPIVPPILLESYIPFLSTLSRGFLAAFRQHS